MAQYKLSMTMICEHKQAHTHIEKCKITNKKTNIDMYVYIEKLRDP